MLHGSCSRNYPFLDSNSNLIDLSGVFLLDNSWNLTGWTLPGVLLYKQANFTGIHKYSHCSSVTVVGHVPWTDGTMKHICPQARRNTWVEKWASILHSYLSSFCAPCLVDNSMNWVNACFIAEVCDFIDWNKWLRAVSMPTTCFIFLSVSRMLRLYLSPHLFHIGGRHF